MFSLLPIQKIETVTPFSLHALQKLKWLHSFHVCLVGESNCYITPIKD
jgi:hypothetical protein